MADEEQHVCATPNCEKAASLRCPTCIKLGLRDTYFCSQDCFKGSWNSHKTVHKKPNGVVPKKAYNPWPGFKFTGPLRPFPLTPTRVVPAHIAKPDYAVTGIPVSEQQSKSAGRIIQLSKEELDKMRIVCKLGREVLDVAAAAIRPGVTTDEIDRLVHEASIERDCYPSPLNYFDFPKSCCTSVNEVICHGIPDTRELREGDICNVDISVYYDGYHADLNETMFVGTVDERSQRLVATAYECMMEAIKTVRPGVRYRDIGGVIQQRAQKSGCSVVKTYCGHGINSCFHTVPNVPHYAKNKAIGVMKPGHTFTIEPMISEGTWRDITWPDNWTAVTTDGLRSAQFEHTLAVTETGYEILTERQVEGGLPHFMTQKQ